MFNECFNWLIFTFLPSSSHCLWQWLFYFYFILHYWTLNCYLWNLKITVERVLCCWGPSLIVMCASCLSRFAVQRPRPGHSGWAGVSWHAAAARASGRQLLLPAPVRPAHVHHPQDLQQKDSYKRQKQRARGGQSCLPVSITSASDMHLFNIRFYPKRFKNKAK